MSLTGSQSPGNGHLDRTKDVVPTGCKDHGHLLPGQPPGPSGQKPGIGGGQVVLPLGPWDTFHLHPAVGTVDPAKGIQEKHGDSPQGNKLETALRQGVIAGAELAAAGTGRPASFASPYLNLKDQALAPIIPPSNAIHETMMQLNPIQDRLEQHPVSPLVDGFVLVDVHHARGVNGMLYFQCLNAVLGPEAG